MQIYEELKARGLIAQVTDEPQIRELINNGGAKFYIGFDPTADSPACGTLYGAVPYEAAADGGQQARGAAGRRNGLYRRPLRRTDMRAMMNAETIQHNCECFKKQMERFIDFERARPLPLIMRTGC